ncbi:CinA family protein [Agromyces lapidis]|uniref:CinA family protein n=1 Tax=Agromyces lapidis TaxID=279574 RepID=A0ABV5SQF7_9MICO|nr:nicotinamide-nucleotide amidohydrolase family protein [Agromyces lapidis]
MPRIDASTRSLIELLTRRGLRIAVAESLTGGLVVAELTSVPGASAVVSGGVVAYDTAVKRSLLGVDGELLAREGPVHPEVARQMARGVRTALAIEARPADVGLATTGVAGPDWQGGHPPGTVYLGLSFGDGDADATEAVELAFSGDRAEIRRATVRALVEHALRRLGAD